MVVALVGLGTATAAVETKAVPDTWLEFTRGLCFVWHRTIHSQLYFLAFQFDKVQSEVNNGYVETVFHLKLL